MKLYNIQCFGNKMCEDKQFRQKLAFVVPSTISLLCATKCENEKQEILSLKPQVLPFSITLDELFDNHFYEDNEVEIDKTKDEITIYEIECDEKEN